MYPSNPRLTPPAIPVVPGAAEPPSTLARCSFGASLLALILAAAGIIVIVLMQVAQPPAWVRVADTVVSSSALILAALGATLNLVEALRILRRVDVFDPHGATREQWYDVAEEALERLRQRLKQGCAAGVAIPAALTLSVVALLLGLVPPLMDDGVQVHVVGPSSACTANGARAPFHIDLDSAASTDAVSWSATPVEKLPNGTPWATITPPHGTLTPPQHFRRVDVIANPQACRLLAQARGSRTVANAAFGSAASSSSRVYAASGNGVAAVVVAHAYQYHVQVQVTRLGRAPRTTTVALTLTPPPPTPVPSAVIAVTVVGDPSCRALPPAGSTSGPALASFGLRITSTSASTVSTNWSLTVDSTVPGSTQPWATASRTHGKLVVGQSTDVQVTSAPKLCASLIQTQPLRVSVSWTAAGGGHEPVDITVIPPQWPAPTLPELGGAIGSRYIPSQDRLIFVESAAGRLSAIDNLSTSPTYRVLGSGYANPQDVAVMANGKTAFVTELNGDFLRVDLAHPERLQAIELMTGLVGAHQIVLDEANRVGYFVDQAQCGRDETHMYYGRLFRVGFDVSHGSFSNYTTLCLGPLAGLGWKPVGGLALTNDFGTAYMTGQRSTLTSTSAMVMRLDHVDEMGIPPGDRDPPMTLATLANTIVSTAPLYYLTWITWTDKQQQTSLLVTERDPANKVWQLDVTGGATTLQPVVPSVPFQPSSAVQIGSHLYVCSQSTVTQYTLPSGAP